MLANNETGVIQPVAEAARHRATARRLVHCDAVQAAGKIPVDVRRLDVDPLALSAHKSMARKGRRAVREAGHADEVPDRGGSQERNRRAGTENVAGIVGHGPRGRAALGSCPWRRRGLRSCATASRRPPRLPGTLRNGEGPRVPNTANISFEGIEAESLLMALDLMGIAVSTGAACAAGAVEPSHVLRAMGLPLERVQGSVRFSLGRTTTDAQVDRVVEAVFSTVERQRRLLHSAGGPSLERRALSEAADPSDESDLSRFGYPQELKRTPEPPRELQHRVLLHLARRRGLHPVRLRPGHGRSRLHLGATHRGGRADAGRAGLRGAVGRLSPGRGSLQWARRLVGPRYGWFVGWIYGWALIITIAAVDLGAAPYLAQLLGLEPSRGTLLALAVALLVVHTVVNRAGVRATALITTLGLATEVVADHRHRGALLVRPGGGRGLLPAATLLSRETPAGTAGAAEFLAAILALAWIFYGFESAADVAEEVIAPGRRVPRAMILSLIGAAGVTALLLVALVLSAPTSARPWPIPRRRSRTSSRRASAQA
jgi:hypothetical protein